MLALEEEARKRHGPGRSQVGNIQDTNNVLIGKKGWAEMGGLEAFIAEFQY